jgi:hypothetical protein
MTAEATKEAAAWAALTEAGSKGMESQEEGWLEKVQEAALRAVEVA